MTNTDIEVSFGVHVPHDSVQSMITGMAAYGIVHDTDDPGTFKVEVFRASKQHQLEKQLTEWENYGFLKWGQI